MKCNRCRDLLSWYLESDLEPRETAEVAEHLSGCRECSYELELLKEALILARDLPKVTISPETRSQLLRRIKRRVESTGTVYVWEKVEDEKRVETFMLETGQRMPTKRRSGTKSQHWSGVVRRYDGTWQIHGEVRSA